jgi:hypothetical protein
MIRLGTPKACDRDVMTPLQGASFFLEIGNRGRRAKAALCPPAILRDAFGVCTLRTRLTFRCTLTAPHLWG